MMAQEVRATRTWAVQAVLLLAGALPATTVRSAFAQVVPGDSSASQPAAAAAAPSQAAVESYNRGIEATNQGKLADAIAAFSRAIELSPSFVRAYSDRGLARERHVENNKVIFTRCGERQAVFSFIGRVHEEAVLGQPFPKIGCRLFFVFDHENAHGVGADVGAYYQKTGNRSNTFIAPTPSRMQWA